MADLPAFHYERPGSLDELHAILAERAAPFSYLAGGTDLFVALRAGKKTPELLIDLKALPGLCGIAVDEGTLRIGALTTIHALERNELVFTYARALSEAAAHLGSWQVRNKGTIGGNIANGSPTADTAPPLLALNACIVTWSPSQKRRIPAGEFWSGAGKTVLRPDEIITGVEVACADGFCSAYTRLSAREAMDIAIAGAAVVLDFDGDVIQEARIALGGAGPTPLRARSAEEYLMGRAAGADHLMHAGTLAIRESDPRTSSRASREYRLAVIPVLVERSLRSCVERSRRGVHR